MHNFKEKLSEIIIDEEFMRLMPPLNDNEFCSLENDILVHGCMNPLVLWDNILIDGHNRYQIVKKHNLPFNTISLEFNSRDEAISWMITIQIFRRNLTPMQLTYYRGLQYNLEKKIHGGGNRFTQNLAGGQNHPSGQNVHLDGSTANRLSEQYKVTARTIRRDGEIADVLIAIGKESQEAKNSILTGDAKINRKQLREMASASEKEIVAAVKKITSGTFDDENKTTKSTGSNKTTSTGNHPITATIIDKTNNFLSNIHNLNPDDDSNDLKSTIRSYIDNLETIYQQI